VWQWPLSYESPIYAYIFPKLLYPLNNIALSCSINTTVGIAYERYTAVCQPFSYSSRETGPSAKPGLRLAQFILAIVTVSVLINLPRFLEVTLVTELHNVTSELNVTEVQELVTYDITQLRRDPEYIRYYINYMRLISTCLIPMVSLIGLNAKIFQGIRRSHARSRNPVKKEMNLASLLICIVFVFLFCNIPRVFINCYEFICSEEALLSGSEEGPPPEWILCLTSFNHLALVLNASVNFLIYFSCGAAFKRALLNVLPCVQEKSSEEVGTKTATTPVIAEATCL